MDTNLQNLKSLVADFAVVDPDQVTGTDTLGELGLDSLDLLQLGLEIEDEFGIELPEGSGLVRENSISDLHDLIEQLQAA